MSITLNTLAYTQDTNLSPDKVAYTGPSNTFSVVDVLTLGRVKPKPTATFAGVARFEAKRTKTVTLADGTTANAIVTISGSLPVGMAQADAEGLLDDAGDFAISTEGKAFMWKQDLTF